MEAALRAAGRPGEKHIYPDTPRGFHADYRPSYRPDVARDAWGCWLGWFQRYPKA